MYRLRDHLLACPALTLDQDISLIFGVTLRKREHFLRCPVVGQEVLKFISGLIAAQAVDRVEQMLLFLKSNTVGRCTEAVEIVHVDAAVYQLVSQRETRII